MPPDIMNLDVLISTVPDDIHAGTVSLALEQHGARVQRWYPSAYPLGDTLSFQIDAQGRAASHLTAHGAPLPFEESRIGAFWYRRQGLPTLSPALHPADVGMALKSTQRITDDAMARLSQRAGLPVNPFHQADVVERSKMLQLRQALALGLACPPTLISNDPDEVRAFIRRHEGEVVFKSLYFSVWDSDAGQATNFTAAVGEADLPSDAILRSCPGIFQRRVEKSHELRVVVMGTHVTALQLDSQFADRSRLDWRVLGGEVPMRPVTLAPALRQQCIDLIQGLGLCFGSIDLIVDVDGRAVFLEVNQQGQFLWLEEHCPEVPLSDTMAQFLLSGDPHFAGPPRSPRLSFNAARDAAWDLIQQDLKAYDFPLVRNDAFVAEPASEFGAQT
jgi:hypothetical protein